MSRAVKYLDSAANHFAHNDWNYTRHDHIKSIRYTREHDRYNLLFYRVKRSFRWAFTQSSFMKYFDEDKNIFQRLVIRFETFIFSLKRDDYLPDGVLNDGSIITFWEETGEYLQMVQPSVGSLLVNFLKEDPENPHAKLIIAEIDRILDAYDERIKNKEVD